MWRTGILALMVSFVLTGCNFNLDLDTEEVPSVPQVIDTINSEGIILVGEGEACGSKVETLCQTGLFCAYTPGKSVGECEVKEIDPNITCEKVREPVCALKDRTKLGYLNECEARRHGAEILNEGFCNVEVGVNPCLAPVRSLGNCADTISGFELQAGSCTEVVLTGCEIESPFESLDACNSACL